MMLVVTIGLFHGLLVTPVMFYLVSLLPASFSNVNFSKTPTSSLILNLNSQTNNNFHFEQLDLKMDNTDDILNKMGSSDNISKNLTLYTNSKLNGILTIYIKPNN